MARLLQPPTIIDYRCIKRVRLVLTRLHALIGPNDSGKSSILRALIMGKGGWLGGPSKPRTSLLRLDPDELRLPTPLLLRGAKVEFASERGAGLAALYDALLSRDRDAFIALESRFKELFPTVRALRLDNVDSGKKVLGLTLIDGAVVPAEEMSEGMLYWLAFAMLEHLDPVDVLLIEEPENGLHPSRIREVMRIFRAISERTQILMATHSPLVINELAPEEVTIITRTPEEGTRATPMTATKNFAERAKVYALGELWLSYADGDLESELVSAGDAKAP